MITKVKNKVVNIIPFLLVGLFLCIMYGTSIGIPGITQYWSDFKLFDLQYLYSIDTYKQTLSNIGMDGIRHYLYYIVVDFGFILVLFWAQCKMSHSVAKREDRQFKILFVLVITRGILDIVEDTLLALLMKEIIPVNVVPIASYITLLKLCCMYIWIIIALIFAVRNKIKFAY